MAFTASMTQGTTWTGLLSNTMPSVRNEVTDLMRKQRHMLPLYQQFGRVLIDEPGHTDLDLFIENEDTGLTPVSTGYETTTPTATDQPHGAPVSDSYYLGSIQVSEVDLMKADRESSVFGLLKSRYYKKVVAIEKDFDSDAIYGNNASNSLRMYGLEQLVSPFTHSGTTGTLTAEKWKFQQCTNDIQGVDRTAWTSATAGGSGFESLAVNADTAAITSGHERFALTSNNIPIDSLLLLQHMDFLSSDGGDTTDVLLCSPTPFEDLMNCQTGLIRYTEGATASGGAFKYPKWKDKFIIGSSLFQTSGLVGNAAAAGDVIWGLNMSTLLMKFASNGFFRESEWKDVPMSPLAWYMAFFVACQHKFVGRPDRNFCYFKYGV